MKIKVERKWPRATYCVGNMYIDGEFFSNTLEDRIVDIDKSGKFDNGETKVYAQSAIPYGTYEVVYNYSPKFKRNMPRLLNVPHFEGILIHAGTTAKNSAGCILVGKNSEVGKLTNSKYYETKISELIKNAQSKGEKITIEIV